MNAPTVLRDDLLDGQRALVTGAGSGIGRGIALRLIELGAHVVGVGRHAETLEETRHLATGLKGGFEVAVGNVRNVATVTDIVERVGEEGLDILVNNAGGQFFAPAEDITPGGWRAIIELNLDAVFTLTRAAYPFLARGGGAVVNISLQQGRARRHGHGASHRGSLGRARVDPDPGARVGTGPDPGQLPRARHRHHAALGEEADEFVRDALIGRATPMRRATEIEEVAEVVAFLCRPMGEMMTGQLVQLDGGAHLGPGLHMPPEAYP